MRGDVQAIGRAVLLALLAVVAVVTGAAAQDAAGDSGPPAVLQADEVVYNQKTNVVTARGNVEVAQGERILLTDRLSYDLDADVIRASGEVTLLEPSGEVLFAESVELTGDLREGAVRSFRMLLTDRSRLAAANAVRVEGNRTILRKVVFSPCRKCIRHPDRPPLWQIKAQKVIHDQEARILVYRDAWLEMFGLPVLYTPYFEHPDPTVDRKTGFLTPSFGASEELGFEFSVPYYYAISPQRDLTLEPIFTSREAPVMSAEYRAHTAGGQYRIAGSATVADRDVGAETRQNEFRGHLDAEGHFNLNRFWRWGFDANRASDDTFTRIYDFEDERFLTSEAFVEGFGGNNYLAARTFAFQAQRRGDETEELPIVLPEIRLDYLGDPDLAGGRLFADAGLLGVTRTEGRDSRRLSGTLGWKRPFHDGLGGILEVTGALHTDFYATSGLDDGSDLVNPPAGRAGGEDFEARVFPQVAVGYRYPLARESFLGREVLEPRIQIVAGPNDGNSGDIPNEDSRDFEFDTSNLFALNRFPGRDRISSGQRIDYGVAYDVFGEQGSSASAFLGQSFRVNSEKEVPEFVGEDGEFSDIVGRVGFSPIASVDATYRFRVDNEDLTLRRSEVNLGAGPRKLRLDLSYSLLDSEALRDTFDDREELFFRVRSRFARYWSAFGSHRRDLQDDEPLETAVGLSYHCDCFLFEVLAKRTFFEDREIDPDTSIVFRIAFKHLGTFATQ